MNGKILLSFDIEEFDLPTEYRIPLDVNEQFNFSFHGLRKVLDIISSNKIPATFFVTASFASRYPGIVNTISKKNEVASHNINHQVKFYNEKEVSESKKILEGIIKKKIYGFRMPRVKKADLASLSSLGFIYDSSVSPTYLPGRYNNYFRKRKVTKENRVYEIPISTPPVLRLPYWNFSRLFGLSYLKLLTRMCALNPGFVNIYFHPWEFNDLMPYGLPFYINKKNSGVMLEKTLKDYISWCRKNNYKFYTFTGFLKTF